jgi:DNA polymerase-4
MECRKIIHVDMDAFYAAVEQRKDPSLKGKPVIVGGDPERRGVVSTCSYEARRYGVKSAMPSKTAVKLCPHGIFLYPDFTAYREASHEISQIFHDYTDLVEPLSLDEAFLDVTENKKNIPYATTIAREIRERIFTETGLTASAGVSYNKFLAKSASEINKPDGLAVIRPEDAESFLASLPIGKFFGIGKAT